VDPLPRPILVKNKLTRLRFLRVLWVGLYLLLVAAPLLLLLAGNISHRGGYGWDLAVAFGFTGMAMMGLQFVLTARFRRLSAPFGIDIIYYFHRYIALIVLALLLLHFFIMKIGYLVAAGPFNPWFARGYMTAGHAALLLLCLLIISSLLRKCLHLEYELWRYVHILFAVGAFLLALGHIEGAAHYIDAPLKRFLWTGYSLLWILLIIYLRLIKPWCIHRTPYRVTQVQAERGNSWTLVLQAKQHPGMKFLPGQFVWLSLRHSPYAIKEHPFSFSSSASRNELALTIKACGDFTHTIKDVRPGETAWLDGPYGVFTIDRYHTALGYVFIAGGMGIAPIMSMLRTLADRGDPRPALLIYANNERDSIIFYEELERLTQQHPLSVVHVLAQPPADWQGERGFVTTTLLEKYLPGNATQCEYFLCGPVPMSNAVQRGLHQQGIPASHVHFELFDLV